MAFRFQLSLTLLLVLTVRAQQPPAEDGFRVSVTNAEVSLQATDPKERHWVLDSLPADADILVTNAALKERIKTGLTAMRADASCLKWAVELGVTCSLSGRLAASLTDFKFSVVNMIGAPEEGDTPRPILRVRYAAPVAQTMATLRVAITTANSLDAPQTSALKLMYPAAVARLSQHALTSGFDAVEISVGFAAADSANDRRMQDALLRVALDGLEALRLGGFEPGKPAPTPRQMQAVAETIAERYRIPRTNWPVPRVDLKFAAPGSSDFIFSITSLQIVRSAHFRVVRGQIEGVEGMVDFVGATVRGEDKIQRTLANATGDLNRKFKVDFDKLAFTVPLVDQVETLRVLLNKDRTVSAVTVRAEGSDLVFEGERRWVLGALNAKATLAAAFDPREFITGQAQMDGSNLLPGNIRETYALTFRGGPEVQKADFTFAIPRSRGAFDYGFDLNAFYHRDRNQRLGNRIRDNRLLDRERGLLPRAYGEVKGGKRGWETRSRVEISQDWREVLIEPRQRDLPALINGQLSAWNFFGKQTFGMPGAKTGFGPSRINFEATKRMGRRSLHGEFPFDQFLLTARGQIFFGPWTPEDFLLRYKRGAGQSSSATPIFLLHRLGGPDNVRGLENGEFIGRQLGFEQSEFGIKFPALLRMFGRKPVPPPAEPTPPRPLDLKKLLLVGFYDRGMVVNRATVGDLLGLRGAAHGYGLAVEMRELPVGSSAAHLQLGWARSPNSVLHKKGLLSVRIVFDF